MEERVATSGFLMDENSVAILSGTDEGAFSWFTLNVLVDRMKYIVRGKKDIEFAHCLLLYFYFYFLVFCKTSLHSVM